ncbi:hypothetical protein FB451DRAFT_1191709 [Mycena latifolia]|nr:hypothetical protein FB451DRAFT_1191709 [Mycena latifolia]
MSWINHCVPRELVTDDACAFNAADALACFSTLRGNGAGCMMIGKESRAGVGDNTGGCAKAAKAACGFWSLRKAPRKKVNSGGYQPAILMKGYLRGWTGTVSGIQSLEGQWMVLSMKRTKKNQERFILRAQLALPDCITLDLAVNILKHNADEMWRQEEDRGNCRKSRRRIR